jgi:hypothetical protein
VIAAVAFVVVTAASAVGLALAYLRTVRLSRPPIGVFNRSDITAMTCGIAVAPGLYLLLPKVLAGALFGLTVLSVIAFTLQPAPPPTWVRRAILLLLAGLAIAVAGAGGSHSRAFATVNAAVVILCVVGITNLWAQTGMRTGHLLVLAALLTVYDVVFTALFPVTSELLGTLGSAPVAPVVFWPVGDAGLGLGLGDLLVLSAFVLVAYKDYGAAPARRAAFSGLLVTTAMLVGVATGALPSLVPTMAGLGPLVVASCWSWQRRLGTGRTVRDFYLALHATPILQGGGDTP